MFHIWHRYMTSGVLLVTFFLSLFFEQVCETSFLLTITAILLQDRVELFKGSIKSTRQSCAKYEFTFDFKN